MIIAAFGGWPGNYIYKCIDRKFGWVRFTPFDYRPLNGTWLRAVIRPSVIPCSRRPSIICFAESPNSYNCFGAGIVGFRRGPIYKWKRLWRLPRPITTHPNAAEIKLVRAWWLASGSGNDRIENKIVFLLRSNCRQVAGQAITNQSRH